MTNRETLEEVIYVVKSIRDIDPPIHFTQSDDIERYKEYNRGRREALTEVLIVIQGLQRKGELPQFEWSIK